MEFMTTERGETQFLNDQYLYNKNKTGHSGSTYWNASKEGVTMDVKLESLLISTKFSLKQTGQHNHPMNPELTTVKKIRPIRKGMPEILI